MSDTAFLFLAMLSLAIPEQVIVGSKPMSATESAVGFILAMWLISASMLVALGFIAVLCCRMDSKDFRNGLLMILLGLALAALAVLYLHLSGKMG